MALNPERKTQIIEQFRQHDGDTGSPEVQIAILTERIQYLTEHWNTWQAQRVLMQNFEVQPARPIQP